MTEEDPFGIPLDAKQRAARTIRRTAVAVEHATSGEQLRNWTRVGLMAAVEYLRASGFSDEDLSTFTTLEAALETLNHGRTPAILKAAGRTGPGRTSEGPAARAKACAVFAVDVLRRSKSGYGVTRAIRVAADAVGMAPSALTTLRSHVLAKRGHGEVRAYLHEYEEEFKSLPSRYRVDWLLMELRRYRPMLKALRKTGDNPVL